MRDVRKAVQTPRRTIRHPQKDYDCRPLQPYRIGLQTGKSGLCVCTLSSEIRCPSPCQERGQNQERKRKRNAIEDVRMTQKPPSINSYFLGDSIKFMIIGLADHDDNWLWAACVPKPLDIEQPWYHWTERCLYRETCPCDIPWRLACVKSGPARFNSVVCIEEVFEWKKRRKWTPERKAKFRMANLEKRVAKRNPMFYEWEKGWWSRSDPLHLGRAH